MSEKPLSKRQQSILNFMWKYIDEHGRPPTIREIGNAVGITSTSVVNYNLDILVKKGLIVRDADVSRGLRLTELANAFVDSVREVAGAARETLERLIRIPLAGTIVASEPLNVFDSGRAHFDTEDDDQWIELSKSMLPDRTDGLFALRVSGDSMIDAMVNHDDIVIMRQQSEARNGDMVAVWLEDDRTTLKYFYNEGNRVRLQPANPTMGPIYVAPNEVKVQGKVVMVLRQTN